MLQRLNQRKPRSLLFNVIVVALFAWFIHEYMIIEFVYAWFFSINIYAFIMFGKDKLAAQVGMLDRTPEMSFHMLGVLGGFPAILTGRQVFHHKTEKKSFIVPMWTLFFAQLLGAAWIFGNLDEVYAQWQTKTEQTKTEQQKTEQAEQQSQQPATQKKQVDPEQKQAE